MNKTVTINISGIIFHIEEDAYESLSRYLATIKSYFSAADGGSEIMGDIEARIAELLQQKLNASKQVILMADVDHIKAVMGKPEEFSTDQQTEGTAGAGPAQHSERLKRRLFRNPDDKAIGGVCGGLAAYFDVDTVWIRLAMFLLIFFGGLSIWVYLILWIIMPEAKTTADKFAMRGEPVTIHNIVRNFKEEADEVKDRFSKYGEELKSQNYGERVRGNISSALFTIFNVLGRLIGLFFILVGGGLLIAMMSLLGFSVFGTDADFTHWRHVLFSGSGEYGLSLVTALIVLGIPVCMLVYSGVKLLFRLQYRNRWLTASLGAVWLLGVMMAIYLGIGHANNYSEKNRVRDNFSIAHSGDTLVIKMSRFDELAKSEAFDNFEEMQWTLKHQRRGYFFGEKGKQLSLLGFAKLDIVESEGDSVEMTISRGAYGDSKKSASENAADITYHYRQNGNEIVFDEVFSMSGNRQFSMPAVDVRLRIPKGKMIYLDRSVERMLDDVENVSNTWDADMVGRRWIMTDEGLKCVDCEDLNHERNRWRGNHHRKHRVRIDKHGVEMSGDDIEVRIDENGVETRTERGKKRVNVGEEEEVETGY